MVLTKEDLKFLRSKLTSELYYYLSNESLGNLNLGREQDHCRYLVNLNERII